MIQLQNQALIICYEDGRMEPLHLDDLIAHLTANSDLPSVLDPWLMEKIVESIIHHFRNELQRDRVPLVEFISLTKKLLEGFFREAMQNGQSPLQLDLFETARNCGNGFELEFFSEIRKFLQQFVHNISTRKTEESEEAKNKQLFRITGLRRCAKYLSGRQRWSKNCSQVRDEILDFIRAEAAKVESSDFSLAVLS
jgi:hypothetical protein